MCLNSSNNNVSSLNAGGADGSSYATFLFTNESHTGPPQWGVSAIIPTFVTGPFTKDEVHGVIKALGTGKSPGCDGIPNEVLKIAELEDTMLRIMNQALVEVPGDWKRTVLVPLPKK